MKKIHLFATAMALFMGLSFTSCLDSDNDTDTLYVGGFVKVSGYMGYYTFKGPDGKSTINPSSSSITQLESNGMKLTNVNIAFVQGTYSKELNPEAEQTQEYKNVNLSYAAPLDGAVEIVYNEGAENDSINYACIRSIENTNRGNNYYGNVFNTPWFFYDKTSLILPISYALSGKKHHKFTLVYRQDLSKEGEEEMTLYLRHYNAKDSNTNYDSFDLASNYPYAYFYAFDLNTAMYAWANAVGRPGELPDRITIKYVADEYSTDLKEGEEKSVTVERKPITLQ